MLKPVMTLNFEDIMDLDALLDLDEDGGASERTETSIAERDRDIYRQIDRHDLPDRDLILSWLEYRKLIFLHEAGAPAMERLPGMIYANVYRWAVRAAVLIGLAAGMATAYSFLAYHGSRPVNVTVFAAFFIVFQAFLSALSASALFRRVYAPEGRRPGLFQALAHEALLRKLRSLVRRAAELPGGKRLSSSEFPGILNRFDTGAYGGMLFWPVFLLSSLLGFCFACGALAATLFRVMVTDLAFGWQSTLVDSAARIHDVVSGLALPWSWIAGGGFAVPSPAQIEGSRIILKQGIEGLATEHLVAWWPFLCMGILVYAVLPRLVLLFGAHRAIKQTLDRFDFDRPRYKRLVMRMRSPRMDTDVRETGGTCAAHRAPVPRPEPGGGIQGAGDRTEVTQPADSGPVGGTALVLASGQAYPDDHLPEIYAVLDIQYGMAVSGICRVSFDYDRDAPSLSGAGQPPGSGPVILLQEVWQPPIRGLLHYLTRIRQESFAGRDVWIFLTQTPGETDMSVDAGDVNFQVWKTAVSQLKDPGIIVERWMP